MSFLYLSIAIIAEVIATSALKASNGFSVLWPSLATIFGYGIALFFLSLTMKTIPMGIAYAIWSGAGIILISTVGLLVFKQQLDLPALIGLAFMIIGIIFINVFSKSTQLKFFDIYLIIKNPQTGDFLCTRSGFIAALAPRMGQSHHLHSFLSYKYRWSH